MLKSLKVKGLLIIVMSSYLTACSTASMSFTRGFLEGYNEKMREERYINNMIQLEKEKQKTYLCMQKSQNYCD